MSFSTGDVRERIIAAASPLFSQRGIRQITREEIQRVAGVTRAEFELEFTSRDDLATECLERREQEWTAGVVEAGVRARGTSPEGRLLAIFDLFDEWFHRHDYEALSRVDELLQMGKFHPLGRANAAYLTNIRQLVSALAIEANLEDPDEFSKSWHVLVTGSITNAVEGDENAAARAKEMGRELITRHQPGWHRQARVDARPVSETLLAEPDWLTDEYDSVDFGSADVRGEKSPLWSCGIGVIEPTEHRKSAVVDFASEYGSWMTDDFGVGALEDYGFEALSNDEGYDLR